MSLCSLVKLCPSSSSVQAGLNINTGIPIVYPHMAFLESRLSSKFNTVVTSGKSGSLGLKGFVDKLNGDVELLSVLVFVSFPPHLRPELISS
jgi:hypothetical protein